MKREKNLLQILKISSMKKIKKIIEYSGLDPPSALLQKNVDELQEYQKIVGKRINKTGHTIGCLKNRINNTAKKDLDEKTKEKN